jgi:hypothetical protein
VKQGKQKSKAAPPRDRKKRIANVDRQRIAVS